MRARFGPRRYYVSRDVGTGPTVSSGSKPEMSPKRGERWTACSCARPRRRRRHAHTRRPVARDAVGHILTEQPNIQPNRRNANDHAALWGSAVACGLQWRWIGAYTRSLQTRKRPWPPVSSRPPTDGCDDVDSFKHSSVTILCKTFILSHRFSFVYRQLAIYLFTIRVLYCTFCFLL